jgi:hypothetical protein
MAAHEHRLFYIKDGKLHVHAVLINQEYDYSTDYDDDDWEEKPYEDTSGEFKDCADGWYWQWRRVRELEEAGSAMGPLNGPFSSEQEARAHHADPTNAAYGMGRLFGGQPSELTEGPFRFE